MENKNATAGLEAWALASLDWPLTIDLCASGLFVLKRPVPTGSCTGPLKAQTALSHV